MSVNPGVTPSSDRTHSPRFEGALREANFRNDALVDQALEAETALGCIIRVGKIPTYRFWCTTPGALDPGAPDNDSPYGYSLHVICAADQSR